MNRDAQLYYCWRCKRTTYWNRSQCQRCLLIRQAKIRDYLIAAACILTFITVVVVKYWSYR